MRFPTTILIAASALLLGAAPAHALGDAAKCKAFKLKVAGGYAECLLKEDAKEAKTGRPADYTRCERKITIKYARADFNWDCDVEGEIADVLATLGACTAIVRDLDGSGFSGPLGIDPGWVCTGSAPAGCATVCGDTLTVGDEFCDDGNTQGSDGCAADCLSGCGDGIHDPAEGEECEAGQIGGATCASLFGPGATGSVVCGNACLLDTSDCVTGGSGVYTDSGQALGSSTSTAVRLGDVDGDGDLDAWVANHNGQANRVWLNQTPLPASSPAGAFTDGRVVW